MTWRRWRRGLLVASNLLLLSAVIPALGYSDDKPRRKSKREAAKPRSKHKPAKNVHAHDTGTRASRSQASDDDDDDDDDDVAGQIAGACCLGFIGALAEGAADDPSDVEDYHREPIEPTYHPMGAGESIDDPPPVASFDAQAAKLSLREALQEVREECVTDQEQLAEHELTVTFDPTGYAVSADVAPPPEGAKLAACAQETFLQAQVPPFSGAAVVVTMSIKDDPHPAP
jgi:hypothetical protein